jgi:hypothetical protein
MKNKIPIKIYYTDLLLQKSKLCQSIIELDTNLKNN